MSDSNHPWNVGDRVFAQRGSDEYWYPGIIRHIQDGRHFVIFDDGEDAFVQLEAMMPLQLGVGDRLFATHEKGRDFLPGRVVDKQGDQFHVEFEGGKLAWISTARIRLRPAPVRETKTDDHDVRLELDAEPEEELESETWKTHAVESEKHAKKPRHRPAPRRPEREWTIGDRVMALWLDLFWYAGTVLDADDESVSVMFDHGGHSLVPSERVHDIELEEGDRVEGRWKAGSQFFSGTVLRREGPVVQVQYDDGDEEVTLVNLLRLQRDEWLPEPTTLVDLGAGDRILARWFDGYWYPGVILNAQDKRVHVLFDDNDQTHTTWDRLQPLHLQVGQEVQCRRQGGPMYFKGRVSRIKGERIFVQYEDDQEEWTSVRLVRLEP